MFSVEINSAGERNAAQGRTLYGKIADLGLICRRTCANRLRCRAPATSNSAPPSRPQSSSQCSWGPQFIRRWNWNRYAETWLAAALLIPSPGHEPACARATARSGHGDNRLGHRTSAIIPASPGTPSSPDCKTKHAVTFACTTKVGARIACGSQLPMPALLVPYRDEALRLSSF